MKVSIIIPVYKVERYIRECLESVICQNYPELEIIIVDDASPDNSMAIAREAISAGGREEIFRIVTHDVNRGLSAARNSGIDIASGDCIYFLDSDDTLAGADAIAVLAKAIEGCDVAVGNYRGVKEDSSYVSKYNVQSRLGGESLIRAFVRGDVPITAWNKLIARRFFDEGLRFREGILNEDELFSYQLLFMNPAVAMAGEVTYNYSIRPGSIMTTFNADRLVCPVIVYEEISKQYRQSGQNNPLVLVNLDHFAFKRHVAIMISEADEELKRHLYNRLRRSQKQIDGVGKMRYLYNCHLFLPESMGYRLMKKVSKHYASSRGLI